MPALSNPMMAKSNFAIAIIEILHLPDLNNSLLSSALTACLTCENMISLRWCKMKQIVRSDINGYGEPQSQEITTGLFKESNRRRRKSQRNTFRS